MFEKIFAQGTVTVPANSYKAVLYDNASSGQYTFELSTDNGIIEASTYSEDLTSEWNNGTAPFSFTNYGTSGKFSQSFFTNAEFPQYLIFHNSFKNEININYKVHDNTSFMNYFGLVIGITLVFAGLILFLCLAFANKLKHFNHALKITIDGTLQHLTQQLVRLEFFEKLF